MVNIYGHISMMSINTYSTSSYKQLPCVKFQNYSCCSSFRFWVITNCLNNDNMSKNNRTHQFYWWVQIKGTHISCAQQVFLTSHPIYQCSLWLTARKHRPQLPGFKAISSSSITVSDHKHSSSCHNTDILACANESLSITVNTKS